MQEDITNRTVALSVRTASLTARTVQKSMNAVLREIEKKHSQAKSAARQQANDRARAMPRGRQSIKSLMGSSTSLTNVEITKDNLKPFQKVARKYGIDFAVTKEKGTDPPRYLLFFKGKDMDTITAAFREFTRMKLGIDEKNSVKESLDRLTEAKREAKVSAKAHEKNSVRSAEIRQTKKPKAKTKVKVPELKR